MSIRIFESIYKTYINVELEYLYVDEEVTQYFLIIQDIFIIVVQERSVNVIK